mmetsp:Transcript_1186/g.2744  ORF Transcript_1186/g.2744 Transcript_1186/m.2744 type:complete len:308 (+) Transcript_1186:586-1509(+)
MGFTGKGGRTRGETRYDWSKAFEDSACWLSWGILVRRVVHDIILLFPLHSLLIGILQLPLGRRANPSLLTHIQISIDPRKACQCIATPSTLRFLIQWNTTIQIIHLQNLLSHVQRITPITPLDQPRITLSNGMTILIPHQFRLILRFILITPTNHIMNISTIVLLFVFEVVCFGIVRSCVYANEVGKLGNVDFRLMIAVSCCEVQQLHLTRRGVHRLIVVVLLLPLLLLRTGSNALLVIAVAVQSQRLIHRHGLFGHSFPRGRGDIHGRVGTAASSYDSVVVAVKFVVVGGVVVSEKVAVFVGVGCR